MRLEAKKYLFDMQQAAALLTQFTAGKQFADYDSDDRLVWDVVETKLPVLIREIAGEPTIKPPKATGGAA